MKRLFFEDKIILEVRKEGCKECFMYAGDGCSAGMSRSRTAEREILRNNIFQHFGRNCGEGFVYQTIPVQAELFPTIT